MEFDLIKMEAEEKMTQSLTSYQNNLNKISAGRANPSILDSIQIDYFGSLTPIHQLAAISVPEPRQILIKPYDISINQKIVGSINSSSLGINAVDEGDKSRITLPELTTDRRKEMVKSLSQYTEQARVSIRSSRQDANKQIKSIENLPEDDEKRMLDEIQKLTDKYVNKIEEMTSQKEKDLMTI